MALRELCFLTLLLSACEREQTPLEKMGLSEQEAKQILAQIEHSGKAQRAHEPPPATASERPPAPTESVVPGPAAVQDLDPDLKSDHYLVDGLVDVSEAAQSTAHPRGVFVATADEHLLLAPVHALSKSKDPAPSPVAELPESAGTFSVGRGPSLSQTHAYWIRNRELYQHPLDDSQTLGTAIANDARVATRVSAVTVDTKSGQRDLVAYIGLPQQPGQPLVARLWTVGSSPQTLTEPGSAALSVQLATRGEHVAAYTLEGRTSMSILHERELVLDHDQVTLGSDHVVWVGGAATPTTELRLAGGPNDDLFGLLPIEQDTTHFGLALLALSAASDDQPAPLEWATYPNGMDYSPTGGTVVCGRLVALYARPNSSAPHAAQELVLAELNAGHLEHELVLGRSKVFYDLSIAALPGGALVSFVSDRRTWARTLRCLH